MGSRRIRTVAIASLFAWIALLLLPVSASADSAWWTQIAFAGHHVSAVARTDKWLVADVEGQWWASGSGDRWKRIAALHTVAPQTVKAGDTEFTVDAHNVYSGSDGATRSLLLLPADLLHGVPSITGITAFDSNLSDAVYVASDGYSVLDSTDGGNTWLRDGPGLPDRVFAIFADNSSHSVFAGTVDGLWVHHLTAAPRPAVYVDRDLLLRQLGIAAVVLVAAAAGVAGLWNSPVASGTPELAPSPRRGPAK